MYIGLKMKPTCPCNIYNYIFKKFQKKLIPCDKAKKGKCYGTKGKVCEAKDLKKRKCECQAAEYPEEAGKGEEATEDPKGKIRIY